MHQILRLSFLIGLTLALSSAHSKLWGASVFSQDFSSSSTLSSYISATPSTGQCNDISMEANGGTWSIVGGQLQLVRTGSTATTNGAGLTRFTDFAGPPTVLHVRFDFSVNFNTSYNDAMVLDLGRFSATADYNNWSVGADVFASLHVDAISGGFFRFETNNTQSVNFNANGTTYVINCFLNKSATTQFYLAPDNNTHQLNPNSLSFWVGATCPFENYPALNGATSTLTDLRLRFAQGDAGTWKFDNIVINNSLPAATSGKIVLTPAMVLNECAAGDATMLVDEQALSGDPLNAPGTAGAPLTKFQPPVNGSTGWYYPLNAVIDLGAVYRISTIAFYDSNGTGPLTISQGTPFNWTAVVTDNQAPYNQWRLFPVTIDTRYLQVSIGSNSATPNEIVLYGYPLGTPVAPPTPTIVTPPTFDQFIGANTFMGEPLHRQQALGSLREYHNWSWVEGHTTTTYPGYPNNQNGFAPAWTGGNYDPFYQNLKTLGITISPALQQSVLWLNANDGTKAENKPILINSGRNPLTPASYVEHADHLFQFAARYGSHVVADSLLKLRPGNPRLTGLNQVKYYENWNEQDKWWKGRDAYFTPYEYAAMSSADYDGHLGAMGTTVGLKNADPNAKLVMSGIARPNLDYIKALKFWSDYNRNGNFPWSVINVHHYCNNGGSQMGGTVGISPEADNLKGRMEVLRQYRDQYLPNVEFWVSEFGYDTNQATVQHAPPIGTFSAEEVQAQWITRSYLALAAAGVDRAMVYTLSDLAPASDAGLYLTSGLITNSGSSYTPKIGWWYVYSLKNRLAGLRFEAEQTSGNTNVRIYRFKDASNVIKAYAVWCPTSNQTTVNGYSLALQGSPSTASLVTLQSGDPDGVKTPLTITGGAVTLNVSERPVFVLINNSNPDFVLSSKLTLTPAMVTNESGLGNAGMMVDEQVLAGDPREYNGGGAPTTVWAPGNVTASAYIDLGQTYTIDRIYIRDMNAVGDLTIQAGSPGNWTTIDTDTLAPYLTWNQHLVNTSTRYLRFTRANGNSNFSEVVVYGK